MCNGITPKHACSCIVGKENLCALYRQLECRSCPAADRAHLRVDFFGIPLVFADKSRRRGEIRHCLFRNTFPQCFSSYHGLLQAA
jgi:hypothetical protein